MTLDEAMDGGHEVTAAEARREVEKHNCSWAEFVQENGLSEVYDSRQVLIWLGY